MTSLAQIPSGIGPDAIISSVSTAIEREKTKKLDEGQPDIEYAEKGCEADLPAAVDIHGDVIKADWHAICAKANEAEAYEHSLGLWQAMKAYKKYYGQWDEKSQSYQVSAAWQAGPGQSVNCGVIIGIFISGWLIDKFGYKRTLIDGYLIIIPLIAIISWAQNKIMLLFGSLLCDLPFGCFAVLGVSYASEICPISLRGLMTGWINVCWSMGGLIATGVTTGTNKIQSSCVESPWWLVRHGRLGEAERSARRLSSAESAKRAPELVANMALLGDGGKELPWAKWAQAVTQMIFYSCYTAFIGPVCYAIVAEASSTRLRNKSVALGRIT
ncbi:hypothetical protein OIDMADRAFT_29739 [Oidiodendron maius Zn]|uniref:Major facilitator superfamily (MFS) profile domain-containing protein n=1 Tax=Oidiodendron maius (strain Zn) TaxID=913774 RepID=A0A0C3HBV5_OIDMZ|nr:hypothetical protein OIDMADRAFT_29739 [Oidiodendron maius Zn]